MSILSLSHLDLDGIGAQIVLRKLYGEITRMNVGYGKIDEYLDIVEDYCMRSHPAKVFVTDLSFTYNHLRKLSDIAKYNPGIEFYFIDHQPFDESYEDLKTENLTIVITDKACATKLTYLFLKNNLGLTDTDGSLNTFVEYVNGYDIWLEGTQEFKVGFVYNELFWSYKINHFWSKFKDNYNLRAGDKEHYKTLIGKKNKLFKKLDDSGRIMRFGKRILLMFVDDAGGHHGAFGTKLLDGSAHNMVEFSKVLVQFIDEELEAISL